MRTIFLDMDGVVADFDAHASKLAGADVKVNDKYPDSVWQRITADPHLYFNLPVCARADELVRTALILAHENDMDVKFLTAVPHGNDVPFAFYDKVKWVDIHFPGIPVWFGPYSHDKWLRAGQRNILVDDRRSNIDEWNQAGGIGIYHVGDMDDTLDRLRKSV
jgi:5'(3')-deoxyribonucleotidase